MNNEVKKKWSKMKTLHFLLFVMVYLAMQETSTSTAANKKYLGCYKFNGKLMDGLPGVKNLKGRGSKKMTISMCKRLALTKGNYQYFSVSNKLCYGLRTKALHKIKNPKNSAKKCNCKCPGKDKGKKRRNCGCLKKGRRVRSQRVFKRKRLSRVPKGCRAKNFKRACTNIKRMTQQKCFKHCEKLRFKFAGIQGTKCCCGNELKQLGKRIGRKCQCKCPGNGNGKWCGCLNKKNPKKHQRKNSVKAFKLKKRSGPKKPICNLNNKKTNKIASTCRCSGDPHCKTLDGTKFHPQGRCRYTILSTLCRKNKNLIKDNKVHKFDIQGTFDNFGRKHVSFVKNLYVTYKNVKYVFKRKNPKCIWVNGVKCCTKRKTKHFTFKKKHMIVFELLGRSKKPFLRILFKKGFFEIKLCKKYQKRVCGLCGSYDGNKKNDLVDRSGKKVKINNKLHRAIRWFNYAQLWQTIPRSQPNRKDQNGFTCKQCDPTLPPAPNPCNRKKYKKNKFCGLLKSNKYWKKSCLNDRKANEIFENCIDDLCEDEKNKCDFLETQSDRCDNKNKPIKPDWRRKTGCKHKKCGKNEEWKYGSDCLEKKCTTDNVPCPKHIYLDCFCKKGYVRHETSGKCIRKKKCGCKLPNGSYLKNGKYLKKSEDCSEVYYCNKNKLETNHYEPCDIENGATCTLDNKGEPTCKCPDGTTTPDFGRNCVHSNYSCDTDECYGMGDPHFRSIKSVEFNMNSTCTYLWATNLCVGNDVTGYEIWVYQTNVNNRFYMDRLEIRFHKDHLVFFIEKDLNGKLVITESGNSIDLTTGVDITESVSDPINGCKDNDEYLCLQYKIDEIERNGRKLIQFQEFTENAKFRVEFDGDLWLKGWLCKCGCMSICDMKPSDFTSSIEERRLAANYPNLPLIRENDGNGTPECISGSN